MEITSQEHKHVELITVMGRVDSVEAPRLAQALGVAGRRGKHRIVVDMSQVEYMSSAGFRALADANRNSRRHQHGEVILAQIPEQVHEALEIVGFTDYFHIEDSVASALALAENLPTGNAAEEI